MIRYFKLTYSTAAGATQPSFICSQILATGEYVFEQIDVIDFTSLWTEGEGYFLVDFNGGTPTITDHINLQDGALRAVLPITGFAEGSIVDGGEYRGAWTVGAASISSFTRLSSISPNQMQWGDLASKVKAKANITMTTTDPGEGATLDANNFIAVYTA